MKIHFVLAGLLFLASCGETSNNPAENSPESIVADPDGSKGLNEDLVELDKAEQELSEASKNTTSLEFKKMSHDFGKIKLSSENDCVFEVKNTGKFPLAISDVQASCGCTTPQKPEKPIAPGKTDVIKVHFKPSSKSVDGQPVEKTITVTANTDPKITVIRIKAIVE